MPSLPPSPSTSRVSLPRLAAVLAGLAALVYALVPRPPAPAARCPPLHAHCDTAAHEACDTDLAADPAHCGACGIACAEGASCHDGRCVAPVRDVAVGERHVCAADASGAVRCWGDGADLQLGDGSRAPSSTPVLVPGLDDVIELAAAESGTCALRRSGAVACWGTHGAWPRAQPRPRAVVGLPPAAHVALGAHHACAVTRQRELWCWGDQMGPGEVPPSFKPARMPGFEGVIAVAAGASNDCVVTTSGRVLCWQTTGYGAPAHEVEGVAGAASVGTGDDTGCAITSGERLLCWKQYRGASSEMYRASPGPVARALNLAMAAEHACAVVPGGGVQCWGKDTWGELGGGSLGSPPPVDGGSPVVEVADLAGVRRIAAGNATSCAARADGSVACWGEGRHGQLGPAAQGFFPEAVRVSALPRLTAVAAAWHETCAVTVDHALLCWGGPELRDHPEAARVRVEAVDDGGSARRSAELRPQTPVDDVESVVMAYPDVCAVKTDGTVTCRPALGGRDREAAWKPVRWVTDVAGLSIVVDAWDSTGYARLRSGAVVVFALRGGHRPVAVDGLRGVRALGGGERACALTADRGTLCWSHTEVEERLRAGDPIVKPHLLAVRALDGARQLGDGQAITAAGQLVGWGARLRDGAVATFDDGGSVRRSAELHPQTPGDAGMTGVARFAQSQRTLCVLRASGEVACSGDVSVDPVRGLSHVAGLAVGDGHACALGDDGEVWCWGDNAWGAVGQDRPAASATPVTIPWGAAGPPRPAPPPEPALAEDAPLFLRRRPGCDTEGVDACVYLGCAGMACLDAILAETDPVRARYMRRLSDAAARMAQEGLARGEDPGGVAHAEMAMLCATSGPCGHKNESGVEMDDGYACLTAAEAALGNGDRAASRAAQARACHCDPRRAQIPVMGGVLACDGRDAPVQRGKSMSFDEAQEIRACAECSPDTGPAACDREIARLRRSDPDHARYVEAVRVPRCREE